MSATISQVAVPTGVDICLAGRSPADRMPQDNPFPMFPPRDPRGPPGPPGPPGGPGPRGIERGMAAMDINGRMPDRPGTAGGRRPDMPRTARSGSNSRGNYPPPGPSRSASAGRPPGPYADPYGAPPVPGMNRSATMPVGAGGPGGSQYPGQSKYEDPGYGGGDHNDTEDLLDSYYNSAPDEPDMPNFDAHKGGTIDESLPGLETPAQKKPAAASSNQYTAFQPQPGQMHHTQSQPDLSRADNSGNQFANAGFQFDLPEPQSAPAGYPPDGFDFHQDPYTQPPNGQYGPPPGSRGGPMQGYSGNAPPRPYRANQSGFITENSPVKEPEAMDPDQNPDALPHHPAPFRPGHDQGSKPAPVRQYSNAVPQAAPRIQPAQPPVPKPVTHEEIQRLQQQTKGKSADPKLQLELAKKLVEASTVLVDSAHLDTKGKAKAREKYMNEAYKLVKKLVSNGNTEAQFFMADCYGQGQLGLQVDNKEAYNLYHSAAKAGHAQAAYRVAVCCEIGQEEGGGTKRDAVKAVQWYKRSASLGDPPAMYKMGMVLFKGLLGQTKNPKEGISWLKRAAERADVENPHALHELALMYSNAGPNDVIIRDEAYANQLFHQAGELGYKFSQFRLGAAYEYGLMGCPVDPRQSIIWYTHAAAQGEHQSELALSGWYLTGADGILQQTDTEAYLWARKAAMAGLPKAEHAMGYFTEVGIGVAANLDDAKRWYWRAAGTLFLSLSHTPPINPPILTVFFSPRIPQSSRTPGGAQEGRSADAKNAAVSIGGQSAEAERRRLCCNVVDCSCHDIFSFYFPSVSLLLSFFLSFFLLLLVMGSFITDGCLLPLSSMIPIPSELGLGVLAHVGY